MRHRLSPDDHKLISKWLRRRRPNVASPGAHSAEVRKAHRPRPRVVASAGAGDWYVVKVTTRNERKAKADFEETGFEVYLPEFKVERFNRKLTRKVVTVQILFPGYMFVRMEQQHINVARRLESAIDILPGFPAQPEPVRMVKVKGRADPISPIDLLRAAQANLELDDTDEARRYRGETTKSNLEALRKRLQDKRVTVAAGPFAGFPATVDVVKSFTRMQVLVTIFGQDTPIELDFDQVRSTDGRKIAA